MTTYYYTPILSLEKVCQEMTIGDNLMDLPYVKFPQLLTMFEKKYKNFDYLYEGKNFTIFSVC